MDIVEKQEEILYFEIFFRYTHSRSYKELMKYFSDRTLCSGTFPLWKKEGEMFDCVLVSGLTHEKDP